MTRSTSELVPRHLRKRLREWVSVSCFLAAVLSRLQEAEALCSADPTCGGIDYVPLLTRLLPSFPSAMCRHV